MLIAHISDTHIASPGELTSGVAPMARNLAQCIAHINALDPAPDLVLHTGDITDHGTPEEATHAARLLDDLAPPLFAVPGNHDGRATLARALGPARCPLTEDGRADYTIDGFPLRLIALDTTIPGRPGGRLPPDGLSWLRDRLDEGQGAPTLIFGHHPPLALGVPETDEDGFVGADELAALITAAPSVERYLCGHIHLATHTHWAGTVVTTAPSMGMQLTFDPLKRAPSRFLLSPPAYLLHHLTPQGHLVTHQIIVDPLDGPHEFS